MINLRNEIRAIKDQKNHFSSAEDTKKGGSYFAEVGNRPIFMAEIGNMV